MPRQARTNRSIDALGSELRIDGGVVENFSTNRRNTVENASFCEFWRKTWKKTKTALANRPRILTPSLTWHNPHGEAKGGGGYCSFQEQVLIRANLLKAIFNSFSNDFQTSLTRFSTYSQSFFNCFSTVFQVISHLDCHVKTFKIRDIYSHFMPEGFENFRISTSCVILAGQAWS